MMGMNLYSMERLALERHEAVIRAAETRSRLGRDQSSERLAGWLAVHLRLLADRLDPALEPNRPGASFISNS